MALAYVGVGSNLSPAENVPRALRLLAAQVELRALSTFYETEPVDRPGQPSFYNGVALVATRRPPRWLKERVLRGVEAQAGRRRTADKSAPRPIDLDLLLYDDLVVAEAGLVLPDPLLVERPFLAIPLHELAPGLVLPGSGRPLAEVVAALDAHGLRPLADFTRALRLELVPGRCRAAPRPARMGART